MKLIWRVSDIGKGKDLQEMEKREEERRKGEVGEVE